MNYDRFTDEQLQAMTDEVLYAHEAVIQRIVNRAPTHAEYYDAKEYWVKINLEIERRDREADEKTEREFKRFLGNA